MALFDDASLVTTPNGYKAGTLYSIKPTSGAGDMTVVRATTATRVNSAGLIESVANNVPRLDYSNGSCPSLLVEPQRTNLVVHSNNMTTWANGGGTMTQNATTSPDGTNNALSFDNSADCSTFAGASNGVHSWSVYVKQGTSPTASIDMSDGATGDVITTFTFATKTFSGTSAGGSWTSPSTSYIECGNGWFRITLIATKNAGSSIGHKIISSGSGYTYVYGAQLEAGSYPTSYIPTTSAAVTRNADVISKTGISSLIGTEFTLFFDGYETTGGNSSRYLVLKGTGGTYANAVFLESNSSNQIALTVLDNSSATVFGALSSSLTNGQRVKLAVRCKNNDFAFYLNGAQIATQASGTVPTTADIYLGYYTDYADNYNKINSAVIFPIGLTNAELISLTTI